MAERDLSVVVLGATGITGRGVAAYLASRAEDQDISWAAAGRDAGRVAETLGSVGVTAPEVILADVGDPQSLRGLASRARVVLDLVGPYTLYGEPVIEACIAEGAHYVDLTGEIPFVRRMIETAQSRAEEAGVKIVNVSGFEALPADLSVQLAAETARERWSEELAAVDLDVTTNPPDGSVGASEIISGGTLQSLAEATGDPDSALIADPAALIVDESLARRVRNVSPISIAPRFNADGDVVGPMAPAAFINPAVIHRSAALRAAEEDREFLPFRYREGIAIPGSAVTLPLRYAAAAALTGTQALTRSLACARPSVRSRLSAVMRKRLPGSGFGPQGERMESWTWTMATTAKTVGGHYVRVDLDADGHPGYLTTAKMIGEAGLMLADDGVTPDRSGFLTPATALGTAHADRFRHAGVRFQVSS